VRAEARPTWFAIDFSRPNYSNRLRKRVSPNAAHLAEVSEPLVGQLQPAADFSPPFSWFAGGRAQARRRLKSAPQYKVNSIEASWVRKSSF